MGQDNIIRALAVDGVAWRSKLVLVAMAARSSDPARAGDTPHYYGSWEWLALALGYPEYDAKAERTVARCVAELTTAGYIKRSGTRGKKVDYELLW